MSATVQSIGTLGPRLVSHLEEQLVSARRLLDLIASQGAAIRARDVDAVVRRLADIDLEMTRRQRLELERARVLNAAAAQLGVPVDQINLELIAESVAPGDAQNARRLSSELQALLGRVSAENKRNRALMRQELAFLDHLLRLAGQPVEPAYRPVGQKQAAYRDSVLDLRA